MRGQYFLPIALLVIILVATIFTYQAPSYQVGEHLAIGHKPWMGAELSRIISELKYSLVESILSGNSSHISGTIAALKSRANRSLEDLDVSCLNGSSGNVFWLACNITLSNGPDVARNSFNYTYTVPFQIRTFLDKDMAMESNYTEKGSAVYIMVTGNDSDVVNVTVYDPTGTVTNTWEEKLINWHWNSSFTPSSEGNWTIKANDTNTSTLIEKKLYVGIANMTIKTYNSTGSETKTFSPGEQVNVTVTLEDYQGNSMNCEVKVDLASSLGRQEYYSQGDANGRYSHIFKLSMNETRGNMTVTATEHCFYTSRSMNITVS